MPRGCRRDRWRARSPRCAASTGSSCSIGGSTDNPADDLRPPRAWPALPKFLSIEEVDALIAQPDVTTPLGLRDRAMIELLYATGMRVSELVGVRAADLHLDEQYLTCIGKGSKERIVPIGEQAARLGRALSARRRGRDAGASGAARRRGCSSTRAADR